MAFDSVHYWDERYSYEVTSYDWYQSYSTLKVILEPFLKKNGNNDIDKEILIAGCGNSTLGEHLYRDSRCPNITNIDISSVVIAQMKDKYSDLEEMEFIVMNALNMDYLPNDCFDIVIDKGLFDCQLCSQNNIGNVQLLLKEMNRVLKPGGVYIVISHGPPENRLGYFQRLRVWNVEYKTISKPIIDGYILDEPENLRTDKVRTAFGQSHTDIAVIEFTHRKADQPNFEMKSHFLRHKESDKDTSKSTMTENVYKIRKNNLEILNSFSKGVKDIGSKIKNTSAIVAEDFFGNNSENIANDNAGQVDIFSSSVSDVVKDVSRSAFNLIKPKLKRSTFPVSKAKKKYQNSNHEEVTAVKQNNIIGIATNKTSMSDLLELDKDLIETSELSTYHVELANVMYDDQEINDDDVNKNNGTVMTDLNKIQFSRQIPTSVQSYKSRLDFMQSINDVPEELLQEKKCIITSSENTLLEYNSYDDTEGIDNITESISTNTVVLSYDDADCV